VIRRHYTAPQEAAELFQVTLKWLYPPLRSWFLFQPSSDLQGIGHTARVLVWATILMRGTPCFEPVV
jgi:hypothetical protein